MPGTNEGCRRLELYLTILSDLYTPLTPPTPTITIHTYTTLNTKRHFSLPCDTSDHFSDSPSNHAVRTITQYGTGVRWDQPINPIQYSIPTLVITTACTGFLTQIPRQMTPSCIILDLRQVLIKPNVNHPIHHSSNSPPGRFSFAYIGYIGATDPTRYTYTTQSTPYRYVDSYLFIYLSHRPSVLPDKCDVSLGGLRQCEYERKRWHSRNMIHSYYYQHAKYELVI
ncbi:hypothetical protein F4825DRAFT_61975 [Nemania diffusa]|nr:hypothetical protein F4825DRAFT_61975 [Nemania diffusa]